MPLPDKLPPVPQAVPGSRAEVPAPVALPVAKSVPKPAPVAAKPEVKPALPPRPTAKDSWVVQVGAFSSQARAEAAAKAIGAQVLPAGKLWRVRMSGLASPVAAQAALAKARAAGYTDARIQRAD
jgi:rare lipoprotein A